ncbi:hypothetical protein [Psychroserpens sp.]|jgi:hypothetical protein|uniref:hypothetical protein n=1 Tax=Psychroserpens sp. TaxID=2020870 RepID=UPI0039E3BC92
MNSRWYISILIITLTFLGSIASTQQTAMPNQKIVLQFSSENVSTEDTLNTITSVKQQLQTAGVNDIKVQALQNGQLKITYYSNSDVDSIKSLLSNESALDLGYLSQDHNQSNTPSKEKTIQYNFDVYEIHQGHDITESDNQLALEIKVENDRLINPNVLGVDDSEPSDSKDNQVMVAYKYSRAIAIAINHIAYKIPEVRAGPLVDGISNCS